MATNEQDGKFVFSVLDKLVGGADKYFVSSGTTAMVYAECLRNERLQNVARVYLYSPSDVASKWLDKLHAEIISTFGLAELA